MRLIDADALWKTIKELDFPLRDVGNNIDRGMFSFGIEQAINMQETVEAEPIRHGHWKIIDQDVMGCKKYRCELCGAVIEAYSLDKIRYCGNCGAKMDKEADNEQ